MSRSTRFGLLVVAAGFVWGAFWQFAPAESERAAVAPPKWEYMTSILEARSAIATMNAKGDQGWELVAVTESNAYYKRQK